MGKQKTPDQKRLTVTYWQLKMLRLRATGISLSQIARKMGTSAPAVSEALDDIERVFPDVLNIVTEVERNDLIKKMQQQKKKPLKEKTPAFLRAMEEKIKRGYFLGRIPEGYEKGDSGLVQTEVAPEIKQIYEEFDKAQDISFEELSRKFRRTRAHITYILKNPTYKGYIPYRGILYRGCHDPIVSQELWDRVQKKLANRLFAQRSLPEGYKYIEARSVIDPQKATEITEMFRIAATGLGHAEIGRRLHMAPSAVRERIRNPYYANKKLVKGKWVDDDHEPLIDFATWQAANRPRSKKNWEEAAQKRKDVGALNKNKILSALGKDEKTLGEIAKETSLSKATIHRQLLSCQKEGITEKNPPGREKGKWRIKR